jgi:hypothetical protein
MAVSVEDFGFRVSAIATAGNEIRPRPISGIRGLVVLPYKNSYSRNPVSHPMTLPLPQSSRGNISMMSFAQIRLKSEQ